MDQVALKSLETRLKDIELKVCAVLDVLKLELQYTPEKYQLVQPQEDEE